MQYIVGKHLLSLCKYFTKSVLKGPTIIASYLKITLIIYSLGSSEEIVPPLSKLANSAGNQVFHTKGHVRNDSPYIYGTKGIPFETPYKDSRSRNRGRRRSSFTDFQQQILEKFFSDGSYPNFSTKQQISKMTSLPVKIVSVSCNYDCDHNHFDVSSMLFYVYKIC